MLRFTLLDSLQVTFDGRSIRLPQSKKTRALLGYLIMTGAPERRDRLCEMFWGIPDDPRASLRWSLSKLRPVVNKGGVTRLHADRERVGFEAEDITTDVFEAVAVVEDETASTARLATAWDQLNTGLLADCDLPKQVEFTGWLAQQRAALEHLKARLARRLAQSGQIAPDGRLIWADRWMSAAPDDPRAKTAAVAARRALGLTEQADAMADRFSRAVPQLGQSAAAPEHTSPTAPQPLGALSSQKVRFLQSHDGANIAWASVGKPDGPRIVKAANWLSHLELDWEAPIWSPLFRDLAQDHHVIRYDARGCGLSDWDVPQIDFDTFVSDLELVADAAGPERFALLGISQGAASCIEYAARHPERVSHLVLFGGYPAGWRFGATDRETREREAVMVLTETGWGRSDPTYRRLFSQTFMPEATPEELNWFDEFQRRTTSPENAVRFLEAFSRIDVRDRLAQIAVPTLVLHSRNDRRIPVETARALAAHIPGAEFLSLESSNHLLIGREPAASVFLAAVRDFLSR